MLRISGEDRAPIFFFLYAIADGVSTENDKSMAFF